MAELLHGDAAESSYKKEALAVTAADKLHNLRCTLDEVCALLGQARPDPSSTCPPCTECHEGA